MARPLKTIDWNIVEKRMEAGCSAKEIAGALHIDLDTFYSRFKLEFEKSFSDYSDNYKEGGRSNLKYAQYVKAINGNVQMMIWLGKQKDWLNQKDKDPANEDDVLDNLRKFFSQNTKDNNTIPLAQESIGSGVEDQQSILHQECSRQSNPISNELGPTADL